MDLLAALVGITLAGILALVGILHLYWAVGGKWGKEAAVPTQRGKPVLRTGPLSCLAVATLLLLGAALCLGRLQLVTWGPTWGLNGLTSKIGVGVLAFVFLGRAVGDFRYVGFFKKVRGTAFSHWDTVLFSPLCLGLSALAITLSLLAP